MMRIARVETSSGWLLASEQPDGRFSSLGVAEDLTDLLRAGTGVQTLPEQEDLEVLRVGAPLRPAKIVAIGLNYADHVRETGMQAPQTPLVFAKFPSSVIGPDESIVVDRGITQRVDWEVELGVVVGRRLAGHVTEAQALSAIFGYTAANDVSARDVQFSDGQWIRGKSMDTFCPLGPVVVTADEVADPGALRLRTRVNGEVVQDSSTAEMIFSVATLLTFCARSFTLEPGDLLLTGTPWGCGEFMTPQRSLQAGDVVEVEVERVGRLANPVVEAV
jgi:2-keto-4-pentenoate hydratase/2-oxohepta-3-ene-1,7-dioic acid hydratase in catechol pathway